MRAGSFLIELWFRAPSNVVMVYARMTGGAGAHQSWSSRREELSRKSSQEDRKVARSSVGTVRVVAQ